MAIVRSAGTEIIRSIHADDIDSTVTNLIVGIQHHIYTVLSIVFHTATWQASGNWVKCYIQGYDSKVGATDQSIILFQQDMDVQQTFVFNDKFSFNGTEPTDFTGPLSTVAMQDAIADQGSSVSQQLRIITENSADAGHVTVTFVDQNNA
jgi:hypothetical protein